MFKIFVASIVSFFAVYISDCSHNANKIQEEMPVNLLSVEPPNGSDVQLLGSITLTFDGVPTDVTSTMGTVTVSGKTVVIGGFSVSPPGLVAVDLTVTWADGSQKLSYYHKLKL